MADRADLVWMDELDAEVCWRLIARETVGRIGFVWDERPRVLPVNHAVDDGTIVLRTARGTMLGGLGDHQPVAFEVDGTDRATETGWSVLVEGHSVPVTDREALDRLGQMTVHPWAPGEKDLWIRILPAATTGRAISRRRTTPLGALLPSLPAD